MAADAALPPGFKLAANLTSEALKGYGINPVYIVAVRVSDGAQSIVVAEHRPGSSSVLHLIKADGGYGHRFAVPSPQLVDFTVDGSGSQAFLVGSYGTRFYNADLLARTSKVLLASAADRPGFRALLPVSIVPSAQGPVVYGLFYESKDVSKEVGFGRVWDNGTATDLLPTGAWEKSLGVVLSITPHPLLQSALIVSQAKPKEAKPVDEPRHLTLAQTSGDKKEIDVADDLFGARWSPDGQDYAYVRDRGQVRELLWAHNPHPPVVVATGKYFAPDFLNGGKTLVFGRVEPKGGFTLWTLNLPDGTPQKIDLPDGPCIFVTDPSGQAVAAWGPWGLRTFTVTPG